jgi:outer membrane protein OmpA-like peptidoglycan-associated protein
MILGLFLCNSALADDSAPSAKNKAPGGASVMTTGDPSLFPAAPAPQTKKSNSFWTSRGENTPAMEVFAGYQYSLLNPVGPNFNANGGTASILGNITSWLGLKADFSGSKVSGLPAGSASYYTIMLGPQFSKRDEKTTVFVHALGGFAHLSADIPVAAVPVPTPTPTPTPTPVVGAVMVPKNFQPALIAAPATANVLEVTAHENAMAVAFGGGFDVKMSKLFAWRVLQADYLLTKFNDGRHNRQNNFRAATGLVLRFGEGAPPPPPNHPPVVTVAPNPSKVFAGSGDNIVVQATASDPDNDPLTYSWTSSGGKIDGTGSEVRWNSADTAVGAYTITARVDDGRGGTASASTTVQVEPRPNRPPTISCAANPARVEAGQRANITATASDPDNDPLTYSYAPSGGKITGTGTNVQFDSTGLAPGTYTVICRTDDGRGGTAESTVDVNVQKPAEQVQLETKLSLHSIYFPTAQPTVANPNSGLLASQQRTLVVLAGDYKKYLTYKPDAHLILQGHADPRGGTEYNKLLSERRVERTKSFLVEQGVPAGNIETQGLGEEQPMSTDQVKDAINQEQGLTPAQKKQLEKNAKVLALAQNRRVDVTLSTTGQTSTRTYPFNAEDALNLINPKSVGASAKKPAAGKTKTPAPKSGAAPKTDKKATKK